MAPRDTFNKKLQNIVKSYFFKFGKKLYKIYRKYYKKKYLMVCLNPTTIHTYLLRFTDELASFIEKIRH